MTAVHPPERQALPAIREGRVRLGVVQDVRIAFAALRLLPDALVQVGGHDSADLIGEPIEDELMSRSDADNGGIIVQNTEPPTPENELSELVRLAVHRQLVVSEP